MLYGWGEGPGPPSNPFIKRVVRVVLGEGRGAALPRPSPISKAKPETEKAVSFTGHGFFPKKPGPLP